MTLRRRSAGWWLLLILGAGAWAWWYFAPASLPRAVRERLPVAEASLRLACDQAQALRQLHAWAGKPLPLNASSWRNVDGCRRPPMWS